MIPFRKTALYLAASVGALSLASGASQAQEWPSRPLTMDVPTAAGGAESLYVYSDSEMAEADWEWKKDRHLYKLEVDEGAIRHRGDLQLFYEVMKAIREKESPDELVKKYWKPVEAGRYAELLVSEATVVKRIKHASEHKSPLQRANAKMRDDPDNLEFYEKIFPRSKDKMIARRASRSNPEAFASWASSQAAGRSHRQSAS